MARLQELNSNSFEYNSNGFELGLGSVWPKMFGFLVELRNMMKEYMAMLETKNYDNKGIGIFCKCVCGESKRMEYFYLAP